MSFSGPGFAAGAFFVDSGGVVLGVRVELRGFLERKPGKEL